MSNHSNNEIENSIIHLKNYIVHKINDLDQYEESVNNNLIDISQNKHKNKNKDNLFNLEKKIFTKFNKKYKIKYSPKRMYNDLIMNTLLFNKNTHLVSVFKDYMIYDYIDEFFKRFYSHFETAERIPKFAVFYKNYLTFFCQPCFANLQFNSLIQKNRERKAELFYNRNFRDKNKESCEDEGIIEDTDEEEEDFEVGKSKIEQTIFNETVKKKIERYSPINTSMALPDSETKLKDDQSGLLITLENEESLRDILKNMINKKKVKKLKDKFEEEMSSIKKRKTPINDNDNKNNQFFNQNTNNISQNIRNNSKKNTNDQNNSSLNANSNNNNIINNKSKDTKSNSKNDSIINKKNKTNKILITQTQSNIIQNCNKKIFLTKNNVISEKNILTSPNNVYSKKKLNNNNNDNKDKNIYIKKIENLNLKKTRCNSNRNLNIKEKASLKNVNNYLANNTKNTSNKNIVHIIKQMKNINANKRPPNITIQDDNCNNYNNILTTNINKNMSEKIIKINSRKFIKQNKSLNNLNNKNKGHGNIIFLKNNNEKKSNNNFNYKILYNNNKANCYSGLYQRTTISQERVKAKLSDELNDILDNPIKIQFQINNRSYSPLNKNKKKSTLNSNSNYSNYLHYQKLIKIKNSHNSSSINSHSLSNNYNNRINCYSLNCRYNNYSSFFLKNNNKNKNDEKNSYINANNNKKKANKKDGNGNKLNINNLIKTQNAEILLHSFKSINPRVEIRKSKQINTPNENRKKISLASLDNININNNPNNNKNTKTNNNEKTNPNRISDKLIKKKKNNIIKRVNKINIITTNKRKDINFKGNKSKVPSYEFEINQNKLDKHQKSNSQNNLNNIYLFNSNNNKKLINCNIINFNSNVPKYHSNQRNNNINKNTRLNSMNITYNQKMSCESSYGNALNSTNINNTTSNNTQKNKNTLFSNNKNDTETKKSLMTFVVENNNNEKNRISDYRNNKNKYYYKEESLTSSPYKNLKNLNININNQININNNNIINDLMPLKNNSKIIGKKNYINKSNKKILLSRNKQNCLDFTSINSFLSSNSNYSNIRKNYLNKNENPIDVLISSKNLNTKENNKTTLYYNNNVNKSSNINNYSYNKSSRKNNSSNIIKISNMKQNKNDVFKSLKNMTDKIYIKLKYKNFSNSRIINQKRESLGKKHLKKSSTYHILPK